MPTHVIKTFSPPMCSSSGVFVSILNMIWKKLLRCRRNSILRERKQEGLRNQTEGSLAECTNADSSNVDSEYNMKILPSTKKQAYRLQTLFWLVLKKWPLIATETTALSAWAEKEQLVTQQDKMVREAEKKDKDEMQPGKVTYSCCWPCIRDIWTPHQHVVLLPHLPMFKQK